MLQSRKARPLFGQALYLRPADAELHFEFGKTLVDQGQPEAAVAKFRAAVRIDPEPLYWAWLAKAQAEAKADPQDVLESCRRAAQDSEDEEVRKEVGEAYRKIEQLDLARDFDLVQEEVSKLKLDLTKVVSEFDPAKEEEHALERYLAHLILMKVRPDDAGKACDLTPVAMARKEMIESAAAGLVREQGLYGTLALAISDQDKRGDLKGSLDAALHLAERAVSLNPFRSYERAVLGQIYFKLSDYERAEAEWKTCLDLAPTDLDTRANIAITYQNRGVDLLHPERRKRMFESAIESYGRVLRIAENQVVDQDAKDRERQLGVRGNAHYWLGRFHLELLHDDEAISALLKAKGLRFKPLESTLHLGSTYVEAKAYDKAENVFREGIEILRPIRRESKNKPEPSNQPASLSDDDMPISELLARDYFGCAFAYLGRGVNLRKARRLAQLGLSLRYEVGKAAVRGELEAIYHERVGSHLS